MENLQYKLALETCVTFVFLYFTENQVSQPVQKLQEIMNNNPSALGQYGPSKDCGEWY